MVTHSVTHTHVVSCDEYLSGWWWWTLRTRATSSTEAYLRRQWRCLKVHEAPQCTTRCWDHNNNSKKKKRGACVIHLSCHVIAVYQASLPRPRTRVMVVMSPQSLGTVVPHNSRLCGCCSWWFFKNIFFLALRIDCNFRRVTHTHTRDRRDPPKCVA